MNSTDNVKQEIDETNICGVCLEPLEKTNICVTSCGHTFCLKCIIKNTNYNNNCPYCRTEIVEKEEKEEEEKEEEEEEEEEEDEEEDEEDYQYQYGRSVDHCYHFPIVIEEFHGIVEVMGEVCGRTPDCDSLILGILSIMNDNEETKMNLMDDKSFENEIDEAEHIKLILTEAITIYKRSILLKKCLQNNLNSRNNHIVEGNSSYTLV